MLVCYHIGPLGIQGVGSWILKGKKKFDTTVSGRLQEETFQSLKSVKNVTFFMTSQKPFFAEKSQNPYFDRLYGQSVEQANRIVTCGHVTAGFKVFE